MRNLTIKTAFLLLFLSFAPSLFALTLSVMIVETGVNEDTPRIDASSLWEGGIMDVFFDSGHIISNAPILRLPEKPRSGFPEERLLDISEAEDGGAEYYILAVLDYENGAGNTSRPRNISLRLVRLSPRKVLYEKKYNGNPVLPIVEERESAKRAAKLMLSSL